MGVIRVNDNSSMGGKSVTPGTDPLPSGPCRGLYVGTGGDVEVIRVLWGDTLVYANVPSGTFLPIACTHVLAANTTASDIIAEYR